MANTTQGTIHLRRLPTAAELNEILQKAMNAVATEAIAIIRSRTAEGRDVDGATFVPYKPTYAKAKGQAAANLKASGDLLANLKVLRIDPTGNAIIGWDSTEHAEEHYTKSGLKRGATTVSLLDLVEGLQQKREFFGIRNPEELARLAAICEREIAAGLSQLHH